MYKNRNMKGGNATSHSAEFYGKDSGSYSENPPAAGGSAYGEIRPVSHGTILANETGPNLAVYPDGGHIQTGGAGCGARRNQGGGAGCGARRNQGCGAGCGARRNQGGGAGCSARRNQGGGVGRKNRTRKNKKRFQRKSQSKRRQSKRMSRMSRKNKKSRSARRQ